MISVSLHQPRRDTWRLYIEMGHFHWLVIDDSGFYGFVPHCPSFLVLIVEFLSFLKSEPELDAAGCPPLLLT